MGDWTRHGLEATLVLNGMAAWTCLRPKASIALGGAVLDLTASKWDGRVDQNGIAFSSWKANRRNNN